MFISSWGQSLLRNQLGAGIDRIYNLLDQGLMLRLRADPTLLRQELAANAFLDRIVCIDETQKCPAFLDEIQLMIEEQGICFLMTGSSARELRRGGGNLLGGRGRDRVMRPLSWVELKEDFNLLRAFRTGLIPGIWLSEEPEDDLDSCVGRYLSEEIAAGSLSRNIPALARFLHVSAAMNAQEINYSVVASDAGLARRTAQSWFGVLEDTFPGEQLLPWTNSVRRKAIERSKCYLFDLGVVRALRGFPGIYEGSADFGQFFEHFIWMELAAWRDWQSPRTQLRYWRSTSGFEVDFILDDSVAMEVKSTRKIDHRDLKGPRALKEEGQHRHFLAVCREPAPRRTDDGIDIPPWELFLARLWNNEYV